MTLHSWNNSLTNADVHRRLPCEGTLWEAGQPVRTPFFGVASRSFIAAADTEIDLPLTERQAADDEEIQSMGGFAFSIEAMENLNLITTGFLRRSTRFQDAKEAQIWLMQFKALDLRLVKYGDPDVLARRPELTLWPGGDCSCRLNGRRLPHRISAVAWTPTWCWPTSHTTRLCYSYTKV